MTDQAAQGGDVSVVQVAMGDDVSVPSGNGMVGSKSLVGGNKEEHVFGGVEPGAVAAVEMKEPDDVPEEIAGWVEKLERGENIHLPQPVVYQNQILLQSVKPGNVKIVLPLTQAAVEQGLHLKIWYSLRWLSEWCVRLIKLFPGKVFYRKARIAD